jgi:hypothetical protein
VGDAWVEEIKNLFKNSLSIDLPQAGDTANKD